MRILFYSFEYGSVTTTFIRNELDYFSQAHEIRYLCQRINPEGQIPDYVDEIPFTQNKILKSIKWMLWKKDIVCNHYSFSYSNSLKKYIERFSPDIIHCHFAFEGLWLLDNINTDNVKIILHFHGYDATQLTGKRSYLRRLKRLLQKPNVTALVCSKYFLSRLSDLISVQKAKFRVIYYGIDVSRFKPTDHSLNTDGEKLIVQISSLAPKKGHEFTLRAFADLTNRLRMPKCRLLLSGEGKRIEYLKSLVEELGIKDKVNFIGNIKPAEAIELLNKADVFVHHSVTDSSGDMEGVPNSIIEAMAMELPVVSTWHSGISELVEDGVNGHLVNERDVSTYTEKLMQALNMGKLPGNRTKVVQEFNKSKHNVQLENYYNDLLNS